jgi:hypothetical protein
VKAAIAAALAVVMLAATPALLARAYEAARQRDIRMLEITSSNQR